MKAVKGKIPLTIGAMALLAAITTVPGTARADECSQSTWAKSCSGVSFAADNNRLFLHVLNGDDGNVVGSSNDFQISTGSNGFTSFGQCSGGVCETRYGGFLLTPVLGPGEFGWHDSSFFVVDFTHPLDQFGSWADLHQHGTVSTDQNDMTSTPEPLTTTLLGLGLLGWAGAETKRRRDERSRVGSEDQHA